MRAPALYERLGIDLNTGISLPDRLKAVAVTGQSAFDLALSKRLSIDTKNQLALCYYLLGRVEDARPVARALVCEIDDYFFGNWADAYQVTRWVDDASHRDGGYKSTFTPGRAWCRREFQWMEFYRDGLLWSLWLDDMPAAVRLSSYAGDDLRGEEIDFNAAEKAWRLVVAAFLSNPASISDQEYERFKNMYKSGACKRVMESLWAISNADVRTLHRTVSTGLRSLIRAGDRLLPLEKVSPDLSIVWHLARRAGLSLSLKPGEQDRLII